MQQQQSNSFSHPSNAHQINSVTSISNPYRLLIEQMPVAVAMVDKQMNYIAVSQQWQETFDLVENWLGFHHHDLFLSFPQTWLYKAQCCLAGNLDQWEQSCYISLQNRYRQAHATRPVQWMQWKVQSWRNEAGEIGGLILIVQNASTAEIIIPDLSMVQTSEAVLWMTSEGYICYANEAACHSLGYDQFELLQLKIDQIDPDMVPVIWQEHCQQLQQSNHLAFTAHHQTQTQQLFPVSIHAHYLAVNSPEPIIAWWIDNATDKKVAKTAIIGYQDQLKAVLNAIPGLVSWIGSDLTYLGVNQHLADAYNLPVEAFTDQPIGFLDHSAEFNQFVDEFFSNDKWVDSREITNYVNQKSRIYLIQAQKYQRGAAAVFVGLDITERIQIEVALKNTLQQENDRKETLKAHLNQSSQTQLQQIQTHTKSFLDQVVAGVAHEINNPISFIYGNLFHVRNYFKDFIELIELYQHYYPNPPAIIVDKLEEIEFDFLQEDSSQLLESMATGAERVRQVVQALSHFSHLDKEEQGTADLEQSLNSTILILKNRLLAKGKSKGIQLVKQYSNLPHIECYPRKLNQVFFNLITDVLNRLEAEINQGTMTQTPTLTIKTEVQDIDAVRISISGNTTTLTKAACQQSFDYSVNFSPNCRDCKQIGLLIAHQLVVEEQQGRLECVCQPGQGTTFQITIPRKISPFSKHHFLF
ncbi:MAG: PAS domain-containing protein [Microcoleaceae cyanobacterium]